MPGENQCLNDENFEKMARLILNDSNALLKDLVLQEQFCLETLQDFIKNSLEGQSFQYINSSDLGKSNHEKAVHYMYQEILIIGAFILWCNKNSRRRNPVNYQKQILESIEEINNIKYINNENFGRYWNFFQSIRLKFLYNSNQFALRAQKQSGLKRSPQENTNQIEEEIIQLHSENAEHTEHSENSQNLKE